MSAEGKVLPAAGARRGLPPLTREAAAALTRDAQAALVDLALDVVLSNAAARAALQEYNYTTHTVERAGRDAVRLASKRLRAAYGAYVARAEVQVEGEDFPAGFPAGLSPRHFYWPRLREIVVDRKTEVNEFAYGVAMNEVCAAAEGWPRLRKVLLDHSSPRAISMFLAVPLPEVEELRLACRFHIPEETEELFPVTTFEGCVPACEELRAACLPLLQTLELRGWKLDAAGAAHLAAAEWPRLTHLVLTRCALAPGALEALGAAPWAPGLEALDVTACKLDASRVRALREGRWTRLRRLSLKENPLGGAELQELLAGRWVADLEVLNLFSNSISSGDARALSTVGWHRLRRLELSRQGEHQVLGFDEWEPALDEWDSNQNGAHYSGLRALKADLEARHPGLEVSLYD